MRWTLMLLVASLVGLGGLVTPKMGAPADATRSDRPDAWSLLEGPRAGPVLVYGSAGDAPAIRIDCVGPGQAMPLLDMSRPFSLRLSLRSERMAGAWLDGRQ